MIGRIVGAALGGAISKEQHSDPVRGAIIGAAAMFVARRILPARMATVGAAVAAGYIARKLGQRAERREAAQKLLPAPVIGTAGTASPANANTNAARKRVRRNDAASFALPLESETPSVTLPPATP